MHGTAYDFSQKCASSSQIDHGPTREILWSLSLERRRLRRDRGDRWPRFARARVGGEIDGVSIERRRLQLMADDRVAVHVDDATV